MYKQVIALALGVACLTRAAVADACTCAPLGTPQQELEQAAAVFEGRLVRSRPSTDDIWGRLLEFEVRRAWKGAEAGTRVSVLTGNDSAGCGWDFEMPSGVSMLIYAHDTESGLVTGLCTRSAPSEVAAEDFAALGEPLEPPVDPFDPVWGGEPSGDSSSGCAWSAPRSSSSPEHGAFAAVLLALAALRAVRRRSVVR